MKRELIHNVMVLPYHSGDIIETTGFLSAVIGGSVKTAGTAVVKVEHSDDGETFEPVTDEQVFMEKLTVGGELSTEISEELADTAGVINIDVDLVGLKKFIKFTVTGTDDSLAVVLGDKATQPV